MKSRRIFGAGILLFAVLAGYGFFKWWSEPRFEGRRVSAWFQEFCRRAYPGPGSSYVIGRNGRETYDKNGSRLLDPAQEALRKMGAPAAAYLENRMAAGSFVAKPTYRRTYGNLPFGIQRYLPNPQLHEALRIQAAIALAGMGPEKHRAVPAIIDLIIQQSAPFSSTVVAVLPAFEPPAAEVERLVIALTNAARYKEVKEVIDRCPSRTPEIVRCLGQILESDLRAHGWVFYTLRGFGRDARVAVPVLQRTLTSTNREARYQSVLALEAIGTAAVEAIPALTHSLDDENPMVQSAAKRALSVVRGNQ